MKKLYYTGSFLVLLSLILSGCVSAKKFKASEWMRERYVNENLQLKQDTTLLGMKYRSTLKSSVDMTNYMGMLVSDTARLNRQLRLLLKNGGNTGGGDFNQEMMKLLEKEKQINEKEAKIIQKELALLSVEEKPGKGPELSAEMQTFLDNLKVQIGVFAVDKVTITTDNGEIMILIPNNLCFDTDDKNVKGKGLSILIKLAETLKNFSYKNVVITTALRKESSNSSLIYDTRRLAGLRGLEMASVMERYGIFPQMIVTSGRLLDESSPENTLFSEIRIR
ncbi:MAG: hypothetical protein K1X92_10390 [Bacteroidia bacterium]|nr:hypothetical protein [Bacteroidia bacterium]